MRISIRRCLSMLRNTSDGNELAVPLPMPSKGHSVGCGYAVRCLFQEALGISSVTCYSDASYAQQ